MKRFNALFACLCILPIVATANSLTIHGSNTVGAELAPELVKRWLFAEGYQLVSNEQLRPQERQMIWSRENNAFRVHIHAHGSSTGFRAVIDGQADLAMSSRPIRNSESSAFADLGGYDPINNEHVVALDGIAVIVHPGNPLATLSLAQIRSIFSGRTKTWADLGWANGGQIALYARDDNSGTYDAFGSMAMGGASLDQSAMRYESNSELSDVVSGNSTAIGFVALPYIRDAKALRVSDGAQAIEPDTFWVSTEDYALSRRLYFYVPERRRNKMVDSFLNFAASDAGQQAAQEIGFVSQALSEQLVTVGDAAPEEYRGLVSEARRLSLNVRFLPRSYELDGKAEQDLKRIYSYMARPENLKKRVMLMGFTDSHESQPFYAQRLSEYRVDQVARQLIQMGIAPTRIRAYGQELPVASNDTEVGRQKNRRVEVWVQDVEREWDPRRARRQGASARIF